VIAAALRAMLPATVAVAAGPVADLAGSLFPEEEAVVARAVAKRRDEFAAGRAAAREALALAGVAAGALPKGPGGAVVWPAGAVGSISHAGGMVAAVAARRDAVAALGIDLEVLSDRAEGVADAISDAGEAARARIWDWGLVRLFSAKEAAFKALYPAAGVLFGFDTLEVTLSERGFVARVMRQAGPVEPGVRVAGMQTLAGGFAVSAVVMTDELWRE
jgi:4'-phosphopantetheinyl transferase EntD